jgi:hypothetical protein
VVDIADMSTLKPLLEASGNKTELRGSFLLNWEGRGSLPKLTENGFLKLAWKNGQLGNMKALTANIDATYSPAGLEIPTFFIGSDRMDFQAIVSAKGEVLEISKIQLIRGRRNTRPAMLRSRLSGEMSARSSRFSRVMERSTRHLIRRISISRNCSTTLGSSRSQAGFYR